MKIRRRPPKKTVGAGAVLMIKRFVVVKQFKQDVTLSSFSNWQMTRCPRRTILI